ncbi:MAG: hypothetical protein LBI39_04310 [Puniceicoccales bacterium]|nr:hypothetical protein [Puniceicoccales bacterium]
MVNVSYGFILNFNYNLAVANWRALNVAEKCAAKGKIANVGDEKFKKHIAELRALFAKNSEIADHMRVLEDIDDAIAAQEKVFLTARGVDAKTEVAICIKKLEERRDKYTRRRMNWKVAKALLDVNKAIELKGAKVGDVVLTLLFVRLLLDVAAPSIFKLKLSSGELSMAAKHLDDALKCFGVESSMVYECTKYGPVGVFPETYSPSPISIMPTARRFSGGHSARR